MVKAAPSLLGLRGRKIRRDASLLIFLICVIILYIIILEVVKKMNNNNYFSKLRSLGWEALFLIISKGIWGGMVGFTSPLDKLCKEAMTSTQTYYIPLISRIVVILLAILWEKYECKLIKFTIPKCILTIIFYITIAIIVSFTNDILIWYFANFVGQCILIASISSGMSTLRAWTYKNQERTTYDRLEKIATNTMALVGVILGLIYNKFVINHVLFSMNMYCLVSAFSCISRIVFYKSKSENYKIQ